MITDSQIILIMIGLVLWLWWRVNTIKGNIQNLFEAYNNLISTASQKIEQVEKRIDFMEQDVRRIEKEENNDPCL